MDSSFQINWLSPCTNDIRFYREGKMRICFVDDNQELVFLVILVIKGVIVRHKNSFWGDKRFQFLKQRRIYGFLLETYQEMEVGTGLISGELGQKDWGE